VRLEPLDPFQCRSLGQERYCHPLHVQVSGRMCKVPNGTPLFITNLANQKTGYMARWPATVLRHLSLTLPVLSMGIGTANGNSKKLGIRIGDTAGLINTARRANIIVRKCISLAVEIDGVTDP
jgi:hypothetical protein